LQDRQAKRLLRGHVDRLRETEERLRKICRGIAHELYSRIGTKRYLRIEIQTSTLPRDTKGRFRIKPSIRHVVDSFNKLQLTTLLKAFGNFHLSDTFTYIEYSQLPKKLRDSYYKGVDKGFRSYAFRKFLKSVSLDDLKDSPIVYFLSGRSNYSIAETACQLVFPSQPALDEQKAFLDKVERKITEKIRKSQFVPDQPNVLVVNGSNWTVHGYDLSRSPDWDVESTPIRKVLRRVVGERRPPSLSSVLIYEDDFQEARMIENRFAKRQSRLTVYEGMCLFNRKRIAQIRKMKQSLQIRKRIIPSKLVLTRESIATGYQTYSEIAQLATRRKFDSSIDSGLRFVQIPELFRVPKAWFRDPQFSAGFADSGHAVAVGEIAYLVKSVRDCCEHMLLGEFTYDSLSAALDRFSTTVGSPTVLFVPISLHTRLLSWLNPGPKRRLFKFERGKTFLISKNGLETPIFWLTSSHPNTNAIIYSKVHGEWVVKQGSVTDELTIQIQTNSPDTVKVLVKTVVAYNIQDKRGAWCLSFAEKPSYA
jgi:hypothetical protein